MNAAASPVADPKAAKDGRLLFVDGLRGLAAAWVVLFHAQAGGHIPDLAKSLPHWLFWLCFEQGEQGVAIFFALSGFVIAHSLRQYRIDAPFFGRFTLRRALRLDPVYFASIVLILGFALLSAHVKSEPFEWPTPGRVLAHLVYLQAILGYEHIAIIYWTLCLEIQFYLVYCAAEGVFQRIAKTAGARTGHLLVFGPLTVLALLWGTGLVTTTPRPGLFVTHWHGFLLGVFAHFTWTRRFPPYVFWAFAGTIFLAAAYHHHFFNLLCSITASGLVLAGYLGKFGRWLSSRPWQAVGRCSYSLYLVHNPVTGAAFFVIYRLVGKTLLTESIAVVVVFFTCIASGAAFWWLVERPCLALSRKIRLGPRVASRPVLVPAAVGQTLP